ncbi:MAG: hypothetical protein ABR936_13385 [Bacteroidota bacterium]|jgi:hypothetical protein
MKMKYQIFMLFLFLSVIGSLCLSQSKPTSTDNYYVGSAEGDDLQKVRAAALENMIQKIQMFVQSEFKRYKEETATTYTDSTAARVIARSSMKLSEVGEDVINPKPGVYHVTKYVSKTMVDQMFEMRRQKIIEHLDIAGIELGKAKMGGSLNLSSVLTNCYKAFLLLFTLRDRDTVSYAFQISEPPYTRVSKDLKAGIPYAIENVINGIHVRPIKRIEDANLVWKCAIDYFGAPVTNMQFSFYDGAGNTYSDVRNGEALLTFFFPTRENRERDIDIKIEYRDEENSDELLEIAKTISAKEKLAEVVTFKLPVDEISVPLKKTEPKQESTTSTQPTSMPTSIRELIAVQESWNKTKPVLMELNRRKHIIVGRREDFESTEGLFVLTVDKSGAVTLLQCNKDKLCDLLTKKDFSLQDFSGRPIYWIEALK